PDGTKLSKRKNPTSVFYYERAGFLAQALLNYLGQLGWSMPNSQQEKFTLGEMVEAFTVKNPEHGVQNGIDRVSTGGPIFDRDKLTALNSEYIAELDPGVFFERISQWVEKTYLRDVATLIQSRTKTLGDMASLAGHFFMDVPTYAKGDLITKQMDADATLHALHYIQWQLDALRSWTVEEIKGCFEFIAGAMEVRQRHFNKPFFVAMSGSTVSTPLYESMHLLGADLSRVRIRHAIYVLTAQDNGSANLPGKKAIKRMEKAYQALRVTENSRGGETHEGA
ncbi:MAG: glutamate--tRNA ligase family protein, partial [Myxococcota bacterium]